MLTSTAARAQGFSLQLTAMLVFARRSLRAQAAQALEARILGTRVAPRLGSRCALCSWRRGGREACLLEAGTSSPSRSALANSAFGEVNPLKARQPSQIDSHCSGPLAGATFKPGPPGIELQPRRTHPRQGHCNYMVSQAAVPQVITAYPLPINRFSRSGTCRNATQAFGERIQ